MNLMSVIPVSMAWTLGSFLDNLKENMQEWVGVVMLIVGIALLGFAVFKMAQGLISHGKTQVNWVMVVLMFIFGAFLVGTGGTAGGVFSAVSGLGQGGVDTIKDLGKPTILFPWFH